MKPALRVVAPGLMTTLQDLGRRGYQSLGIPVSGALDAVALAAANAVAGNAPGSGALEIAHLGPTLEVEAESVRVAFAGSAAAIEVLPRAGAAGGRRLAPLESVRLERGAVLRIGALGESALGYLAVEGGFDAAPVLGSQSTYTRAGLGGFAGRALRAGDRLPLRRAAAEAREEGRLPDLDLAPPRRVRVVLGPQDDCFSEGAKRTLLEATFTVSAASDRMGMRLEGPALEHAGGFNIVSDGIAPGSIQVPGNGLPIVLLADRQTTGGYPKIATVIAADLPALGRLAPDASIGFAAVGVAEAEAEHRRHAAMLAALPQRVVAARGVGGIDTAALLASNLVSGVVSAHDPWPGSDPSYGPSQRIFSAGGEGSDPV
jgi:biotin-dependent carboxylase-like uncharacterized protein